MEDRPQRSEKDCVRLLKTIFGEPEKLLQKFAPEGWENSPLFTINYQSPEQKVERDEASKELKEWIQKTFPVSDDPNSPFPTLEDFMPKPEERPAAPMDDLVDILGNCVWHVFSENHDVVDADGNVFHLGTWRGSARFIADFINEHYPGNKEYGYLHFYMGLHQDEFKQLCLPVFEHIFRTLRQQGCDWIYSFPGVYLISFDREDDEPGDPASYDPAKSMEAEMEREQKKAEIEKMQAQLAEDREEQIENARYSPPPPVVEAYRRVFGELPEGFPQV